MFNGNGYDKANQEMLTKAGVWCINSGVDAIRRCAIILITIFSGKRAVLYVLFLLTSFFLLYHRYTAPKNVALFERMKVLTGEECRARQSVLFGHYIGVVEVEVRVLFYINCNWLVVLPLPHGSWYLFFL